MSLYATSVVLANVTASLRTVVHAVFENFQGFNANAISILNR